MSIEINEIVIMGAKISILSIKVKLSAFFCPRYSAKNLFPLVPKKLVTVNVMIRQKLRVTLIEPSISFPKILATKKLKAKGTKPTNKSARAV